MNFQQAIAALHEADTQMDAHVAQRPSLCAQRPAASSLKSLGQTLLPGADPAFIQAFADGLATVATAQVEHFPETVFWDFDFLAAALKRIEDPSVVEATCAEIARLQAQYGRHSVIRFRYVHDFTYGFDWAKWVLRAPEERASIGPFDPEFIAYLRRRGHELAELIANDDVKYPKLADGTPRNPFGFSREPPDEQLLGFELARRGLVPVETWRMDAVPQWNRPFADLREQLACELGIATRAGAS